jgi:hypothetical protein
MTPRLTALTLFLLPLAACATVEPEPCSAEWIDYKTDKILRKFASENRGLINDFRRLAREDGEVDPFVAISLSPVNPGRIQTFADSFNRHCPSGAGSRRRPVRPPARNSFPALTAFLQDEGVSDEAISWIIPFVGVMTEMRDGTFDLDGHHQD